MPLFTCTLYNAFLAPVGASPQTPKNRVSPAPATQPQLRCVPLRLPPALHSAPCACVASAPGPVHYLDGTARRRKPRGKSARPGPPLLRFAAAQSSARTAQLPPRTTRDEPSGEEVHSQTFPWRSYIPRGFGKYEPT